MADDLYTYFCQYCKYFCSDLNICILTEEDYYSSCPANPPADDASDSDFPVFGDGYFVC